MAKIIWGEDALSDLEVIYDYIARDSPRYARQQVERIGNAVERLYRPLSQAAASLTFLNYLTEKW